MQIEKLKIDYFRCFEHYEIDFARRATVLFGKNGAGKTSLITAIHKALSFVFAKDTKNKEDLTLSAGNSMLRVEGFDRKTDFMKKPETGNAYPYISINAIGVHEGRTLEWTMEAPTSTFRLAKSSYKEAFTQFIRQTQDTWELPVLAYYSDGFPHVETKSKVDKSITSLRNFGYYQWNLEGACSKIWTERLERTIKQWERLSRQKEKHEEEQSTDSAGYKKVMKELRDSHVEIESITGSLRQFTKGDPFMEVKELTLDPYDDKLIVVTTQGREFHFRTLPAGYKRLLYMVLDLAYRSFVLNKKVDSQGIVMIDEMDLHLHPELEKEVLNRFLATFPNIQFIVSTHSPMVLTNLKTYGSDCQILRMETGDSQPTVLGDIYGIDYNSGVEEVMGVEARDVEIDNLLGTLAFMEKRQMMQQATNVRALLLKKLGGDEAHLDRLLERRRKEMGDEIHR